MSQLSALCLGESWELSNAKNCSQKGGHLSSSTGAWTAEQNAQQRNDEGLVDRLRVQTRSRERSVESAWNESRLGSWSIPKYTPYSHRRASMPEHQSNCKPIRRLQHLWRTIPSSWGRHIRAVTCTVAVNRNCNALKTESDCRSIATTFLESSHTMRTARESAVELGKDDRTQSRGALDAILAINRQVEYVLRHVSATSGMVPQFLQMNPNHRPIPPREPSHRRPTFDGDISTTARYVATCIPMPETPPRFLFIHRTWG